MVLIYILNIQDTVLNIYIYISETIQDSILKVYDRPNWIAILCPFGLPYNNCVIVGWVT